VRRRSLSWLVIFVVGSAYAQQPVPSLSPATTIAAATDQYAQLDGVRLRYRIAGAGEPVILIHGYANHLEGWSGLGDSLARDHEVIALDLRGHGQSTKFSHEGDYGRRIADDVVHLLDYLHIRRAHLVGHSMGALVAADIVERYPKRVASVSLLAGPFWPDSAAAAHAVVRWDAELDAGRGLMAFMLWLFPGVDSQSARGISNDVMAANDPRALRAILPSLGALTVGLNHAPAVPVLIVTGGVDPLTQYSHTLSSEWPRARLLDVPTANHVTILNQPQVLAGIREIMSGQGR
jgi:pimeloyl-ACP methyl ester carboxylesterase